jgi:serine/threonine protein kinase
MLKRLFQKLRGTDAQHLPGYTALGLIRQGSMSTIFKARHQETGRIVAVKVCKREAVETIRKIETLHRDFTEGQITASFDHPNVVRCYEHGELGGVPYLVLEYLEGMTLASLMAGNSHRLDGKRLGYLHQAASGLAHVHSRRFIHHDFCPKNLFVTTDDRVKLIDFGLATPLTDLPVQHSRMGTAEILAPELLRREPCDYRIDIFAWGVVAYGLLAGRWPFESREHHQTLSKILNVQPVPLDRRLPALSPEVANLVMRCLAKDPSGRLSSMHTAVGVLERHLESRA